LERKVGEIRLRFTDWEQRAMTAVSAGPRGLVFTRLAIAMASTRGYRAEAHDFAARTWGPGSRPATILKAAVTAGTLGGDSWASEVAGDFRAAAVEFFGVVAERSIVGRMAGLRRTPLRVRGITALSGAVASWAGEAAPKAVTALDFDAETLAPLKLLAICVLTNELVAAAAEGDPDAEAAVRRDLLRAVVDELDRAFIDPANTGVPGEQPASITSGVGALMSADDPRTDLRALVAGFDGDLATAYLIMPPSIATGLCSRDHPFVGARGGEAATIPVLTSRRAPPGTMVLADADSVAFGAREARLDVSGQTVLQFESAPDDPVSASTVLKSLWAENLVGLKVERAVNWRLCRAGAVTVVEGVDYASIGSPA
jgi:hypothetical protein